VQILTPEALLQLAPHEHQSEQALLLKVRSAQLLYWWYKSANTDT